MEDQNKYVVKIRDSYTPAEHTKLDELKELDRKVRLFPAVLAYIFGVVAALVLGTGMCLAMEVIGASLMSPTVLMTVGVIVGVLGIALCIANYFIYNAVLKSRKSKYADKIISISNELLNREN